MIKATELRIGNWVGHKKVCTPVEINIYHLADIIGNIEISEPMYKNDYKPIPLTEEWLLKFGFDKKYQTFEFKGLNIDGTVVHFSFDKWRSEYEIENCDFTEIPAECKYVHQLQNLYFALTGEELVLKEKI